MSLKEIRPILITAIISVAVFSIYFAFGRNTTSDYPPTSIETSVETQNEDLASVFEADGSAADVSAVENAPSELDHRETQVLEPKLSEARFGEDLESYFVVGGMMDGEHIGELRNDDTFQELVDQFREQSSEIGMEKRSAYEILFYSQPQALDGSVSVDLLECGSDLCAAELRANSQAVLDEFLKSTRNSDGFESRATIVLSGSSAYTDGQTRRFVFAHNPEIGGFTVPLNSQAMF